MGPKDLGILSDLTTGQTGLQIHLNSSGNIHFAHPSRIAPAEVWISIFKECLYIFSAFFVNKGNTVTCCVQIKFLSRKILSGCFKPLTSRDNNISIPRNYIDFLSFKYAVNQITVKTLQQVSRGTSLITFAFNLIKGYEFLPDRLHYVH